MYYGSPKRIQHPSLKSGGALNLSSPDPSKGTNPVVAKQWPYCSFNVWPAKDFDSMFMVSLTRFMSCMFIIYVMVPYRVKWLLWDCHTSTNCHAALAQDEHSWKSSSTWSFKTMSQQTICLQSDDTVIASRSKGLPRSMRLSRFLMWAHVWVLSVFCICFCSLEVLNIYFYREQFNPDPTDRIVKFPRFFQMSCKG